MKVFSVLIGLVLLCVASVTMYIYAQPPGHRPGPPRDQILELFDVDEDGEISAEEIDNSVTVLKGRDRDQNGRLTRDELPRPPRPGDSDGDHRPRPREEYDQRQEGADVRNAAKGTVVISQGYQTDPRDHGRPVALIAAALGVEPQVFRDAFSGVTPSSFGPPSASRAHANKKVLMDALGKYGVANDRLDEVSNDYRYRPGSGNLWTHRPASVKATINEGKVTGFVINDAGSGYLTAPDVRVAGYEDVEVKAEIEFGLELRTNGRLSKLTLVEND